MMIKQGTTSTKSALTTALDCLSRRQMSAFQLANKLELKGYSSEEVTEAINKLKEWRYLDDHVFAITLIKSKAARYSRARIKGELHHKGIDAALVERALEEGYPDQKELENGIVIGRKIYLSEYNKYLKKIASTASDSYSDDSEIKHSPGILLRKRIGDKLLSKGYRLETVKRILNEILREID
ncbi:recombination regulator RecX [Dehalobacter sp. DCM]|uniref:regulatory protein RecX n=1 Tax=Dehalobacter sp. DCM TaxID=2907827 RepID=UPI003081589C|nr:recombination regulator RecX [Dehalobacter sp. DCM]